MQTSLHIMYSHYAMYRSLDLVQKQLTAGVLLFLTTGY